MRNLTLFLIAILLFSCSREKEYDILIYGATSAAITAAVQAVNDELSVIIIEPTEHIGGMTTGGLGWTDYGVEEVIGGLSLEFYKEGYKHYSKKEAWEYEKIHEYKGLSQSLRENDSFF